MNDSDELRYSHDAALNRYYFYKEMNDISFFVEDTDKEFEYEEIFERLIPDYIKRGIFPLGGKLNLEDAFSIVNNGIDKVFFIADGDFDLLLGREQIQADNFVYLKKYNIESYLLHKPAVITYMRPRLRKTKNDTEQIINYDNWEQSVLPFFKRIFAVHFIVQKNAPEIKNVSRGAAFFINKSGFPIEDKFRLYLNEITDILPDAENRIQDQITELENTYGNEANCFICGKYLLESLSRYLNTKPVNKKQNYNDLKSYLISHFDISQIEYVKDKILSYIG